MNIAMKMLVFVLCVDLFLFFGQLAVVNINPASSTLEAFDSHLINKYNTDTTGGYNLESDNVSKLQELFPEAQEVEDSSTGVFSDIFNTIRGWFFSVVPLGIFLQIVGAPYFFLKAILPSVEYEAIVFGLGALWYSFSVLALVFVALGRES